MFATDILSSLNDRQQEAVSAPPQNLVILAGAGSGKTRVLVHRIAWLCQVENIPPHSIMAVTFTNKAAGEMRHRIEQIIGPQTKAMWIGTFHGLAHRLLRAHWQEARLPEHFQILDSEDQYRLIRRTLKNLNLPEEKWQPKQIQWFINANKDEGIRPKNLNVTDYYIKQIQLIYEAYENACIQAGLIDFSEILLRAYELWQTNPELLQHYQQRFKHILVDEFQDTNTIQYAWIKLLMNEQNHLMVVGDDDQSIYGWRGAKIENLQKITKDFPNAKIIRLEQNYRSTANILSAANALITHNHDRLGKNLWTSGHDGETIHLYAGFNEFDEARYIISSIRDYINKGFARREIAILYRSNAQSRVLEETLIQAAIPYRIYGGLRFFERAEIKDGLAYLRLIVNQNDDTAFERIVNTPTRGIGNNTLAVLRDLAKEQVIPLWRAAEISIENNLLPSRGTTALRQFLSLINTMRESTTDFEPGELTKVVLETSGLYDHYRKEKGEKGQARIENLDELISAAREFQSEDSDLPLLQSFLAHAALESGEMQAEVYQDSIQLMTLHSAKGLEFPIVFMSGLEEGLFPHQMSYEEPGRLEEERRLCYVGITRAEQILHLSYAEIRRLHGTETHHRPSRFIQEIPKELIEEVRIKAKIIRPMSHSSVMNHRNQMLNQSGFNIGAKVHHKKFGEGIVLACEGMGDNARVQVKFPYEGTKWLLGSYLTVA
ncbi:MAG: DNA helicase II [Gammaproteobacteria bacterium]